MGDEPLIDQSCVPDLVAPSNPSCLSVSSVLLKWTRLNTDYLLFLMLRGLALYFLLFIKEPKRIFRYLSSKIVGFY